MENERNELLMEIDRNIMVLNSAITDLSNHSNTILKHTTDENKKLRPYNDASIALHKARMILTDAIYDLEQQKIELYSVDKVDESK